MIVILLVLIICSTTYATPPLYAVRICCYDNDDAIIDSCGSGSLINKEYVITNHHVIKDARLVRVLFKDWQYVPGRIVKKDAKVDLALIKIPEQSRTTISFAPKTSKGDIVTLFGYGQGLPGKGVGIINSFVRRTQNGPLINMEIDGYAVRSGDSGGPVIDSKGRLSGVIFGATKDESYAVRIETVKSFIKGYIDD